MPPDTIAQPDLVIRGAFLIDGSGKPGVRGDLAVKDDRIVAMGDLAKFKGAREIQANGLALAPGFIDTHTHDDRALLSNPLMECKISQGVTTVITGNCGISLAPLSIDRYPPPPLDIIGREPKQFFATFDGYLSALDRDPPALNAACQVGHTTLRAGAMDRFDRAATQSEIDAMRQSLETSLEHGAIGMSTGLYYPPAKAAPTDEVIALGKDAARLRRHSHHPHARRGLASGQIGERDHRDRTIGRHSRRHLASQGERHAEPRPGAGYAEADRRGAQDARSSASTSTLTSPPRPCWTRAAFRSRARSSSPGRRAFPNSRGRRSMPSRAKLGCDQTEAVEPAAAGRRDLLHDERGRRAARAVAIRTP